MAAAGRLPSARADAAVPTIGRTVYLLGDTASTLTARLRSFFSRRGDVSAMNVPSAVRAHHGRPVTRTARSSDRAAPLQSNWPSASGICAG